MSVFPSGSAETPPMKKWHMGEIRIGFFEQDKPLYNNSRSLSAKLSLGQASSFKLVKSRKTIFPSSSSLNIAWDRESRHLITTGRSVIRYFRKISSPAELMIRPSSTRDTATRIEA